MTVAVRPNLAEVDGTPEEAAARGAADLDLPRLAHGSQAKERRQVVPADELQRCREGFVRKTTQTGVASSGAEVAGRHGVQ